MSAIVLRRIFLNKFPYGSLNMSATTITSQGRIYMKKGRIITVVLIGLLLAGGLILASCGSKCVGCYDDREFDFASGHQLGTLKVCTGNTGNQNCAVRRGGRTCDCD
jgi:hypothetical protein